MLFRLENVFSELCIIHIFPLSEEKSEGKTTKKGTKNSLAYRVHVDSSEPENSERMKSVLFSAFAFSFLFRLEDEYDLVII